MTKKEFDLEERTKQFGKEILDFVRGLAKTTENLVLVKQLVRSGTSVGANYLEAADADSRKDFIHKIRICRREAKESVYWLELISYANPNHKMKAELIAKESGELVLIFSRSVRTALSGVK